MQDRSLRQLPWSGKLHRPVSTVGIAIVAVDQSHANLSDAGTHDVAAMPRAVEPRINHRINTALSGSNVLGGGVPIVAGVGQSGARITRVGTLVRECIVALHPLRMRQSGLLNLQVPGQSGLSRHSGCAAKALAGPGDVHTFQCFIDKCLAGNRCGQGARLRTPTRAVAAGVFLQVARTVSGCRRIGRTAIVGAARVARFTTAAGADGHYDEQHHRRRGESVERESRSGHQAKSGQRRINRHHKQGPQAWRYCALSAQISGWFAAMGGTRLTRLGEVR